MTRGTRVRPRATARDPLGSGPGARVARHATTRVRCATLSANWSPDCTTLSTPSSRARLTGRVHFARVRRAELTERMLEAVLPRLLAGEHVEPAQGAALPAVGRLVEPAALVGRSPGGARSY
eukprot:6995905-Prymnesium_polylepis.1